MLIQIANLMDATDRFTAVAATALPLGSVVWIDADANGLRRANLVTSAGQLVAGNVGLAVKVSTDDMQVSSSTIPDAFAGSRIVSISAGDLIVVAGTGSIVEIDVSLLESTLAADVASNATAAQAGQALAVTTAGLVAKPDGAGPFLESPIVLRVFERRSATKLAVRVL